MRYSFPLYVILSPLIGEFGFSPENALWNDGLSSNAPMNISFWKILYRMLVLFELGIYNCLSLSYTIIMPNTVSFLTWAVLPNALISNIIRYALAKNLFNHTILRHCKPPYKHMIFSMMRKHSHRNYDILLDVYKYYNLIVLSFLHHLRKIRFIKIRLCVTFLFLTF